MNIVSRYLKLNIRRYRVLGRRRWRQLKFYNPEKQTPLYRQALFRYTDNIVLERHIDIATIPYFDETLMAHLKRHLPDWPGFKTEFITYVHGQYNVLYDSWDWDTMRLVVREEQPLLQRDRLMQIFAACPEGSYGYYARYGLAPFKSVVGSFASATIDRFFSSHAQFLKQQFSPRINDIMSTQETRYWNSRKELMYFVAGKTFTKGMRQAGVKAPSMIMTIWEGERVPKLPEGEALLDEQLAEVQRVLNDEALDKLDEFVLARKVDELYDRLVKEGKAKPDSGPVQDE